MTHVGLNTICPVCGGPVPDSMPPMEVVHAGHGDERTIPMLRVCAPACARLVRQEPDVYYRAARANAQAKPGQVP
ncbi:MAG TPA: hypothetical protein VHX44_05760 [Planctomycetota bacterium]|nr:hypothetical protein [Planctomycetota bacterium]